MTDFSDLDGPLTKAHDWSSIMDGLQERLDTARAGFYDAVDDPTFSVQSEAVQNALRLGRFEVVDRGKEVDGFIADVVKIKRENPNIPDAAIHEALARIAQEDHDPTAVKRLEVSTLLLDPDASSTQYIFDVPGI